MKNVHVINVTVDGSKWESVLDAAFNKKKKDIKIDGFRKGAVSKEVYLKKVGIESLLMDAVDIAVGEAYSSALSDNKLVPAIEPKIDIKGLDKDHVEYEFTIITKPEIKLGEYTNLGIKQETAKVTKKEIEEEIARLASKYAEIAVKEEGSVEEGNTAVIDFEGFVDGEKLEGGTGANYPLEIGSHTFIPGFEEGIVGMNIGDSKELKLQFPDNYTEELKGKDVVFNVTLNEIKERIIPELNKEFYLDLGFENVETDEDFRAEVEKTIVERKTVESEDKYLNECLEKAADNMTVEINEEIVADEIHRMVHQFEHQLTAQGLNLEQYFQFTGMTMEKISDQMKPEASKRVKFRYLLEAISEKEKLEVSDKDAEAEVERMSELYGMEKEDFIASFGGLDVVKYDLQMRRAMEIIKK